MTPDRQMAPTPAARHEGRPLPLRWFRHLGSGREVRLAVESHERRRWRPPRQAQGAEEARAQKGVRTPVIIRDRAHRRGQVVGRSPPGRARLPRRCIVQYGRPFSDATASRQPGGARPPPPPPPPPRRRPAPRSAVGRRRCRCCKVVGGRRPTAAAARRGRGAVQLLGPCSCAAQNFLSPSRWAWSERHARADGGVGRPCHRRPVPEDGG